MRNRPGEPAPVEETRPLTSETAYAQRPNSGPANPTPAAAAAAAASAQGPQRSARLSAGTADRVRSSPGMTEWLWAGLLILSASHRATRALALLLALKWAVNYAAFHLIAETAPALIDVALGTIGVIWASRRRAVWSDVVVAGFILTLVVHAWYWLQYAAGGVSPVAYYWLIAGLFTMQVAALAWPGAQQPVRGLRRRLGLTRAGPSGQQ